MWWWKHQMWEKSKGTTKCEKRTITCDVGITQYEDGTVKCEKKNKGTTQCNKRTITCDKNRVYAMLVLLNMTMEPSNLRKKKIKEPLYVLKKMECTVELLIFKIVISI